MALPVMQGTWDWYWNNVVASSGTPLTDHQTVLLTIKNLLIGFAGAPMPVVGSSNSVVAALDAVDRWAAAANIVWANGGAAHSWIVLQVDGVPAYGGGKAQVCIACDALDEGYGGPLLTVAWTADAPFAGGSTIARPTSADEIIVLDQAQWLGTSAASASFAAKVHALSDLDGYSNRVIVHINNVPVAFWAFELPPYAPAAWTKPNICYALGATTASDNVLTYAKLHHAAYGRAWVSSTIDAAVYMGTDGYAGQAIGERLISGAGGLTAAWPMTPVHFISDTVGVKDRLSGQTAGQRGSLDLFMGASSKGLPVDYYPGGGAKTWVQLGCLILPNDGTTVLTA